MGQMSLRYLIFMRCLHKWFEFASVTCIETAEDLVVFQTKNLDTYDQTFHGTHEDVSKNDYDPVRVAAMVAPARISTTSIIAAWLTANAPIRRKESVLER